MWGVFCKTPHLTTETLGLGGPSILKCGADDLRKEVIYEEGNFNRHNGDNPCSSADR